MMQETFSDSSPASVPVPQVTVPKPVQVQQKPVHVQNQQPVQPIQAQQVRAMGRGRGQTVNRVVPLQPTKARQAGKPNQKDSTSLAKFPSVPQIQLQNIQGTVYKIVKVRTKEGSIVTRKVCLSLLIVFLDSFFLIFILKYSLYRILHETPIGVWFSFHSFVSFNRYSIFFFNTG
jgi:hypothetical protein